MLRELLKYTIWADRKTIKSLKEQARPDASALRILNHLVLAETEWLSRLRLNRGTPDYNFWAEMSLPECERVANEIHDAFAELIDSLSEEQLGVIAVYKNSKGTEYRSAWRDVLMHVTIHSAYHRGQAAMAIRNSGGVPVNTDFIGFLREQSNG